MVKGCSIASVRVINLEGLKAKNIDGTKEIVAYGLIDFFKLNMLIFRVEVKEFWSTAEINSNSSIISHVGGAPVVITLALVAKIPKALSNCLERFKSLKWIVEGLNLSLKKNNVGIKENKFALLTSKATFFLECCRHFILPQNRNKDNVLKT